MLDHKKQFLILVVVNIEMVKDAKKYNDERNEVVISNGLSD